MFEQHVSYSGIKLLRTIGFRRCNDQALGSWVYLQRWLGLLSTAHRDRVSILGCTDVKP